MTHQTISQSLRSTATGFGGALRMKNSERQRSAILAVGWKSMGICQAVWVAQTCGFWACPRRGTAPEVRRRVDHRWAPQGVPLRNGALIGR
jgi:hypothetical protein